MTSNEVTLIIAMIVVGTLMLVATAFVVGMTIKSPLPVRVRVSVVGALISAAILTIPLCIHIYRGDSWIWSATLVGGAIASSALVWFAGKKKIEQQSKNEH